MIPTRLKRWLLAACGAMGVANPAWAGEEMRAGGKLLLTSGISTVDGSAGAGLATWALIAGNETVDGIGGSVHATYVPLSDYSLASAGAAIGIKDRLELSYAHQSFDTHAVGAALGLGRGFTFRQDIIGAKLRIAGDAVIDQDSAMPQIAVGVQYHMAARDAVIHAVGGAHDKGADFLRRRDQGAARAEPRARRDGALHQGEPVRVARLRRRRP